MDLESIWPLILIGLATFAILLLHILGYLGEG